DEFSPILAPLHEHRAEMLVLDGLAYLTAMSDPYGDGHAKGWMTAMTGNWARETYDDVKSHALTPSFDQVIKNIVRAQDSSLTDLASLALGVRPWDGTFHHMNYGLEPNGDAVKIPHIVDPAAAFNMLLPDTDGGPVAAARTTALAPPPRPAIRSPPLGPPCSPARPSSTSSCCRGCRPKIATSSSNTAI